MPARPHSALTRPPEPTSLMGISHQDFGVLIEAHRRELQVHCYRMLGSIHDAEDMVQETFLKAWYRRETYAGRASLRAWLYRIATNVCLDALADRPRRMLPVTRAEAASIEAPIPQSVMEPIWLTPFPDDLLGSDDAEPERRLTAREAISVAFMAALHLLPPRQRAILILRDVLEWPASEVADMLGLSVPAVKSALRRARVALDTYNAGAPGDPTPAPPLDQISQGQLERYVRAWESADVAGLVALLKEDASFSMPPIPSWYQGRTEICRLVALTIFRGEAQGRWRLLPTRANGQIAFGLYQRAGDGLSYTAYGIQVIRVAGDMVEDITTFREASLFGYFKLPESLPA